MNEQGSALADKPKIICLRRDADLQSGFAPEHFDPLVARNPLEALKLLEREEAEGLFLAGRSVEARQALSLLNSAELLEHLPDGAALINSANQIVWANQRLRSWCVVAGDELIGWDFFAALGEHVNLGPDPCPFHKALTTGLTTRSTLRLGEQENHFLELHVAPRPVDAEDPAAEQFLIATIRDVTADMLHQQKLAAIHKAGIELADLTPTEVFHMEIPERIELLKANILHYTQDLLNYDVVEIRLLDSRTETLTPLLSVGISDEAAGRPLLASPQGNGVTGWVAATGKSYLCEDTLKDSLYIEGFKGARSSLTVPLIQHDRVIGTFNVESPESGAFTEQDQKFLESFSRDVAAALNTLELLVAQKANAAQESVEAIHSAVALPVDTILNDAVNVMERYIGHDADVTARLHRILKNARDIKQVIQKVGQSLTPSEAVPESLRTPERPQLLDRRVLVVDEDESVRSAAHDLLERYGCVVETASCGGEAIYMIRNCEITYDVIISDVRLPDMDGYALFCKLQETLGEPPMVLMTGFGWDPGHSIVKARQAGLRANAVLYKPFRLDQLLTTVESMVENQPDSVPQ